MLNESVAQNANVILTNKTADERVDHMNIFLACNAITALIIDACLIFTVERRSGRRADLILLTGFAVGNGLTSIGRMATGIMRASGYLNKQKKMNPLQCIAVRYDLGILIIGNDGLTLSGFLLSFERFMFFTNVNAYGRLFNPSASKKIIYCVFVVGLVDYLLCWMLAYSRRAVQMNAYCQRSEITPPEYFAAYMVLTVLLGASSLAFYLLTFVSVSNSARRTNENGLTQMRHTRERKILNGLSLISAIIVAMNLAPWCTYFFIFKSSYYQSLFTAAQMLDNFYLPVSTLLYLIIHPDLARPLRSTLCVRSCLRIFRRSKRISVVYAG
uniref:G-protein coupled receptors family 1 profile domain-containing protein n=1 Tax=Trichuris muris TaxID=70415 RepID=A0A5S6QZK0_TRIMR